MKIFKEDKASIINIKGKSKVTTKKEKKVWSTFMKYIKDKWDLGNDYLSAKVLKEQAQAMNELTQSFKNIQEAKEIAQRIEQNDKNIDLTEINNKEERIKTLEDEIITEMKYLSATYGTKINIEIIKEVKDPSDNI